MESRVAIVTGAASGIGLAISESMAHDGIKVVMADSNGEKLAIEAQRLNCKFQQANLIHNIECKNLIDYAISEYGKVDILVNVAGIQNVCPIEDFPEEKWDLMIQLMLSAPFYLTKYAWKSMKENGWGRIINISSMHGLIASEYKSAYVAAKHGLVGFTKVTGLEGGPQGITCNAICPAYVRTPLVEKQIADQAKHHGISEEDVLEKIILQKAAIKKTIDLKTICAAVRFFCSEDADTITGIALPIDGGWTAS